MNLAETYHLNDKTSKYANFAQIRRKHQYLGLPGNFKTRVPAEMVFTDMTSGRADELYYNDGNLLIDLEEESDYINTKTFEKLSKYSIFNSYWHIRRRLYLAVICHKPPKSKTEFFEYAPSVYFKAHYIYFSQEELWDRYENVINKVEHKETLTDAEALDIAFTSKFISKKYAPGVVEKLCEIYNDAKIEDKHLKLDVKVILSGMILKHINSEIKQEKLMEMIGMRHIENELDELVYEQYGDKLDAKDKEIEMMHKEMETKDKEMETKDRIIETQDKEMETKDRIIETQDKEINNLTKSKKAYDKLVEKLHTFDDFNSPEAQKIINALMLLR